MLIRNVPQLHVYECLNKREKKLTSKSLFFQYHKRAQWARVILDLDLDSKKSLIIAQCTFITLQKCQIGNFYSGTFDAVHGNWFFLSNIVIRSAMNVSSSESRICVNSVIGLQFIRHNWQHWPTGTGSKSIFLIAFENFIPQQFHKISSRFFQLNAIKISL